MAMPIMMESPLAARMRINGREVDHFCSTSYFCLHGHPEVIEAACTATRQFGMGPGCRPIPTWASGFARGSASSTSFP